MSEKGQGDSSAEGAGTGAGSGVAVDGTPTTGGGGGGSQADQSGPGPTDTPSGWDDPVVRAALEAELGPETLLDSIDTSDLGKPEIPEFPEDPDSTSEPSFPGGGPTDTRSGWDKGPADAEGEQSSEGDDDEDRPRKRRGPGRKRAGDYQSEPQPPDLKASPTDRPPGLSDEQFEQWKKDHPTGLDKANTQTDVV